MSNVGDLGRRVAERRQELGLSVDAVAVRAGMNPSYLEMLERSPSPQPSRSALRRLASALETTVDTLTGSGILAPPGRTDPTSRPSPETLDRATCAALISEGGVGRVLFSEPRGPVALPVNFRVMNGGDTVFRTARFTSLALSVGHGKIGFEVDHIDEALGEGWSVLISGKAHVISDRAELQSALESGVTPWAGGDREVYVRIAPREMTGRRIRHH